MARLSKTPGVELFRFESANGKGQIAYYSKGQVLRKVRRGDGTWGQWVRYGKWQIGTILEIKATMLETDWKIVKEYGK